MRKLSTCLLLAILGGAFLVGCGSSKTQSTETITTSSRSSETPGGSTSGTGSSGTGSTGAGGASAPKTAVEACKHDIGAVPTLSASAKTRLEKACDKVGASPTEQRKIVHEVCMELAGRLPAGATRERALAICRAP